MRHIRSKVEELGCAQEASTQQEDDHVLVRGAGNLNRAHHQVQNDHLLDGQVPLDELSSPGKETWVAAVEVWIFLLKACVGVVLVMSCLHGVVIQASIEGASQASHEPIELGV